MFLKKVHGANINIMVKIGLEEINKIIEDCKDAGHVLKMSDIAYVCMLQVIKDRNIVYAVLHGKGFTKPEIASYDNGGKIGFLKKYMKTNFFMTKEEKEFNRAYGDISFEENKEALIKLLDDIRKMAYAGEIDKKDAVKLETDIRTKLNDKFAVSEKQDEQRVIVMKKYNDICICGREIYRPTKDDIIEDLSKDYDLIPKIKGNNNNE